LQIEFTGDAIGEPAVSIPRLKNHEIFLRILANYRLRHLVNNVAIHIYTQFDFGNAWFDFVLISFLVMQQLTMQF
jgi:hypothetical protein